MALQNLAAAHGAQVEQHDIRGVGGDCRMGGRVGRLHADKAHICDLIQVTDELALDRQLRCGCMRLCALAPASLWSIRQLCLADASADIYLGCRSAGVLHAPQS